MSQAAKTTLRKQYVEFRIAMHSNNSLQTCPPETSGEHQIASKNQIIIIQIKLAKGQVQAKIIILCPVYLA